MKAPRQNIAEAIAKRTLRTTNSKKLAQEIAAYLLMENRTHELDSILRDVMQYRQDHGKLEASVLSAHEPSKEVIKDVKRLLHHHYPNAKNIQLNSKYNSDLVGGLLLEFANEQLDLSVQAKINKFKRLTAAGREQA